ncbi:MAG: NAD(+)/NADH kinase [Chloroflexi bacterium]|nr:NAD(+)/NADH kinase [Chloroflexota bacterium]
MARGPIGIIANPASGKDIRRLVAHASVFDNQEKVNIIRRTVLGAVAAGCDEFLYLHDGHALVLNAIDGLDADATFTEVETPGTASALDSERAAARMREAGAAVIVTLGGDGTNRAVARGWEDAPLVAISTGTNNVFPRMVEGTVAGAAAGLVASGKLALADAARQCKLVRVEVEGERDDLALIDAVLLDEPFVGARAIWTTRVLRTMVLTRADPAAVGMSAVGGLLHTLTDADDGGLVVQVGPGGGTVVAPIAPGLFEPVPIAEVRSLAWGERVEVAGPGILALDGERERRLLRGQRAWLRVERSGPWVVDVARTMRLAACRGLFRFEAGGVDDAN